jgi:hypothetical protein
VRVGGAAEQHAGRVQDGQLPVVGGVQGPQVLAVSFLPVPGLAQGGGLRLKWLRERSSGAGMVRRIPTFAVSIRRAAAIPVMSEICAFQSSTGSWGHRHNPVAAVGKLDNLLLRHVQAGTAAGPLQVHALAPHLTQELQHGRGRAGIQFRLAPL